MNIDAIKYLDNLIGEPETIGNTLLALRKCEEITQADFAKQIGISKQQLCDIEHGRRPVGIKLAISFAKALGMNPKSFIRLALQDVINRENLHYTVELHGAA
ncbi:helix-turn-helix transcriptional regulator [Cysteiniphilum halobium]|uniref:helix-turn-helix transcriptional regulator n=1 Tax=Cysteiniphilum halobium TaxID=2219059 RepID=UPI003F834F4A